MKEQVYISGQLGRALFGEGGKYYVAGVEHPERPVVCRPPDLSTFFRYGAEFTSPTDAHHDRVAVALRFQTSANRALSLVLSGMDAELDNDTRSLAIEASEELLRQEPVHHFVRARLLARPVPSTADLEGARLLAEYTNSTVAEGFYRDMRDARDIIPVLLESWHEAALGLFVSRDEEDAAEKLLIEAGVFADATYAVSQGDANRFNNIIVKHGLRPELKAHLPHVTHILNTLRRTLIERDLFAAVSDRAGGEGRKQSMPLMPAEKKRSFDIRELLKSLRRGRERRKPRTLTTPEVKDKVDHQIFAIEEQIQRGNLSRAERYLQDLIRFHVAHGDQRKHVAMSLCSLAKTAMDFNAVEMAQTLISHASSLGLNDEVIWSTQAELLKAMGQLPNALATYNESLTLFPNSAVVRSGRAEVLKAMGQLDEAFNAYEETVLRFPDNSVARNGRAEVLKEMGRLDEALAEYEETTQRFPANQVARNGLANLLMSLNRIDEARTLLTMEHPTSREDWIGYHILAMSYLKTAEIDEAIKRLAYGLENAPWATVKMYFASALSVARIRQRQFAEAEAVLKSNVVSLDVFQRQKRLALLGHSLAGQGKRDEAAATLASIGQTTSSRLQTLREDVILRFNLPPKADAVISNEEAAALDERIDEEEFYLAMAA